MADWIKCHKALTKGNKRSYPRATRFVYLELCLEARELDGEVPLRTDMDVVEAIHDLIGGNKVEIADAWKCLSKPDKPGDKPMVSLVGDRLVVEAWDSWAKADSSTERVRRHRAKERDTERTGNVTETFPERFRGEESREEEKREEERRSPARTGLDLGGGEVLSGKPAEILAGLSLASDLLAELGPDALIAVAKRIEQKLSFEKLADKLDRRLVGSECATYARQQAAKFPHATDPQKLAWLESKADYVLRDVRAGKVLQHPRETRETGQSQDAAILADAAASEQAWLRDREQQRKADRARAREPTDTKPLAAAISKLPFMNKGKSDAVSGSA